MAATGTETNARLEWCAAIWAEGMVVARATFLAFTSVSGVMLILSACVVGYAFVRTAYFDIRLVLLQLRYYGCIIIARGYLALAAKRLCGPHEVEGDKHLFELSVAQAVVDTVAAEHQYVAVFDYEFVDIYIDMVGIGHYGARYLVFIRAVKSLFFGQDTGLYGLGHTRVVAGAKFDAAVAAKEIGPAVAHVADKKAHLVEYGYDEGCAHCAFAIYHVALVEGYRGAVCGRLYVGSGIFGGVEILEILVDGLGHGLRCHFAMTVAAHAVAEHQHAVGACRGLGHEPVFLIVARSELSEGGDCFYSNHIRGVGAQIWAAINKFCVCSVCSAW